MQPWGIPPLPQGVPREAPVLVCGVCPYVIVVRYSVIGLAPVTLQNFDSSYIYCQEQVLCGVCMLEVMCGDLPMRGLHEVEAKVGQIRNGRPQLSLSQTRNRRGDGVSGLLGWESSAAPHPPSWLPSCHLNVAAIRTWDGSIYKFSV